MSLWQAPSPPTAAPGAGGPVDDQMPARALRAVFPTNPTVSSKPTTATATAAGSASPLLRRRQNGCATLARSAVILNARRALPGWSAPHTIATDGASPAIGSWSHHTSCSNSAVPRPPSLVSVRALAGCTARAPRSVTFRAHCAPQRRTARTVVDANLRLTVHPNSGRTTPPHSAQNCAKLSVSVGGGEAAASLGKKIAAPPAAISLSGDQSLNFKLSAFAFLGDGLSRAISTFPPTFSPDEDGTGKLVSADLLRYVTSATAQSLAKRT
jgi:hypothetical protein